MSRGETPPTALLAPGPTALLAPGPTPKPTPVRWRRMRGIPTVPDRARTMRRTATGLLVAMAGLFLVSGQYLGLHPAFGYLRAFAEAGQYVKFT